MMRMEYEYIVVGSGAGGGPVAANLAKAGHTVLLLEAGGSPDSYNYQVPAFHAFASEDASMSWEFFVRHYADDAQQRRDRKFSPDQGGVLYPRAGTLGGCTAHHAMITVYPHNSDWDAIAETTGDASWSADHMHRYFERLEHCRYRRFQKFLKWLLRRNSSRHGFKGWLSISVADPKLVLEDVNLLEIIKESVWKAFTSGGDQIKRFKRGIKALLDPNDWRLIKDDTVGVRLTPLSTHRGRRVGTREYILEVQRAFPDKLFIKTGALVTRVLFDDDNTAVGVEYMEGAHLYAADPGHRPEHSDRLRQVYAAREVVLSGGTFNTPQLLQLSGIGPADLLRAHGIPVRVDLPGVGANLQDRYEIAVVNQMKKPFAMLAGATMRPPKPHEEPDPQFRQWQQGKGIYTTNGAVVAVVKRSATSRRTPDLFLFGLVSNFRGYYPGYSEAIRTSRDYFTWSILKGHTNNTAGRVAIRSKDPRAVPDINFHYFGEGNDTRGEDLQSVVDAIEFVRDMTDEYKDLIDREVVPGKDIKTRDQLRQFVQDEAWGHHASCTCKIGTSDDGMAVLDSRFRVFGTKNLRVVDASVFPRIPGFFIVTAVYMVAEKASDAILADARS